MSDFIELGWLLTDDLHPKYWKKRGAKQGGHAESDLFLINPAKMKHHGVVFAQSGSGKSFLIGRLIEELSIKTMAKCIVFDPNSDYSKIYIVNDQTWSGEGYNDETGQGTLPTESQLLDFSDSWGKIRKSIYSGKRVPFNIFDDEPEEYDSPDIRLNLSDLTPNLFVNESSDAQLLEIAHCLLFAQTALKLRDSGLQPLSAQQLLEFIEQYMSLARRLTSTELESFAFNEYGASIRQIEADIRALEPLEERTSEEKLKHRQLRMRVNRLRRELETNTKSLIKTVAFISEESQRLFMGRLYTLLNHKILYGSSYKSAEFNRVNIIDLPTFSDEVRHLAVGAILNQLWQKARQDWEDAVKELDKDDFRVPTFIFVDEAHNLIPKDPLDGRSLAIREQFRRIAAEGRKFGLFLIAITQRPDKLDPIVVSECENKMILRVGSKDILDKQADVLGLTAKQLENMDDLTRFKPGRAYCIGPWGSLEKGTVGMEKFYTAARRTKQGGRDLDDNYWTKLPDPPA